MSSAVSYMKPLGQLKDNILLISIANAHICEKSYLVKIGKSMDSIIPALKEGISSLKKEYPGKFRQEVNTDYLLDNILATAQTLQKPGSDLLQMCAVGELGRKLESDLKAVIEAIRLIRAQVEGEGHSYSKKDQISGIGDSLGNILGSMGGLFSLIIKLICCVIVIGAIGFAYLFFTMEKEGSLREEIKASQAIISEQQEIVSELELNKQQVQNEIADIEKGNLERQEKISILDLEMKIHQIDDKQHKARTEIETHEQSIAEKEEKIMEIKSKSFFKRLLRQ